MFEKHVFVFFIVVVVKNMQYKICCSSH